MRITYCAYHCDRKGGGKFHEVTKAPFVVQMVLIVITVPFPFQKAASLETRPNPFAQNDH